MKKCTYLLFGLLSMAATGFGQGFYFRAAVGAAMPMAGQTLDGTGVPYNGSINNYSQNSANYTTFSIKSASFSSGFHGFLGAGYMFNPNVGIDLGLDVGLSTTQYSFNDNNILIDSIAYNIKVTQRAKMPVVFIPALLLKTDGKKLNLYSRFGLALPLKTKITQDQVYTNLPGAGAVQVEDYTWEVKTKFSLGFSAAAGVQYQLNDKSVLWCEASILSLGVYAQEANMVEVSVDGQTGYLPQVPVSNRKITYSKDFSSAAGDYYHQPAYSLPFSNVALNVGVSFKLGEGRNASNGKNDVKGRRKKF